MSSGSRAGHLAQSCRRAAPGSPARPALAQERPAWRFDPLIPAALTALLILAAFVLAPERPRDQEAICQRHNGVVACRVW